MSLWKNADRYDPTRSSEPTFIAVIARRRLIDRLRKEKRPPGEDAPSFDPDLLPSAEDPAMNADARQAARVVGALPDAQRKVIALSVIEGMTQEEIATKTKLPLGTVKSHLRRGLLAVREALMSGTHLDVTREDVRGA